MRISIVIPVLNEESQIVSCLERLQPMRFLGHEVIVVDGGSTDATRALAAPLCDRLLRSRPGRAAQMNLGARFAGSDVVLFLHADSQLPEDAEQAIAEALADRKPGWGWFDVRLSGRAPVYRLIAAFMNLRARLTAVCTGDQALFVSAELFHLAGGFPGIPLMEDIAISKKLRQLARPRPLAQKVSSSSRRWERDGVARTILQMWRLRLLYFFGAMPEKLAARYYPRLFARARFKFPSARIAVFAREPEIGEVKTRLAAQIGAEAALRLYLAMLRRVVATVEQAALAEFHLWAVSDPGHEEFTALCDVQDIRLQQGEDLGSRMHNAAAAELAEDGVEFVLIVGSDCPALTLDYLERALDALSAGVEVVLGPARDGGYVLIGLRQVSWELFSGVDWSGPGVLEQTLERVREAGLSHQLLESSWDVDDAEDLPLLEELRPPLPWSR
ncbi:MAG: DUF2064 domain-containing protein [Gammaproteobacteria bacterium]|nr:DUF2064 domain-containing protein [Gammaproteobacteria bacterium]MYL14933.1 DUF2064 domain-containing protein [Gammaproteobacteria bacterium]